MPDGIPAWVLIALALALTAAEVIAIVNDPPGDTITERLRAALGIKPRRWWRPIGITALVSVALWAVVHIAGS